jgi:hypothetical protein
MDTLEPGKESDFLDRFCSFNDAVVRRLEHRYEASGRRQAILTVSARDQESGQGWSNVVIVIDGVSEIGFREGKSTRQVLSDGLILTWFQGHVWCDLSPYTSEPGSIDDVRRSDFYVAGEVLKWRSEPYSEE